MNTPILVYLERTRYRKIDYSTLIILFAILLFACFLLWRDQKKGKQEKAALERDMQEKQSLYKKEAMIAAKESVQRDIEKFQEETKERRQELSKLESKLSRKEEILENKAQEYADKESVLNKKMDELLDKEDYLAELVQKYFI